MSKSLDDIEASFSVLTSNVRSYYTGNRHAYRPVAVELRKLLCDYLRGKDVSLLKRIFPDLRLRPLHGAQDKIDQHTSLYITGCLSFDGKGSGKISQFIDENAASLTIDEWLEQKIIDNVTTIREFIRSVADKEGAHSDKEYNDTLSKTKSVKLSEEWSLCDQFIIGIGRYLIKVLAITMLYGDSSKMSKHIKECYTKLGRGGAVLDLFYFGGSISKGASLDYKNKTEFILLANQDTKKEQFVQIVDSYCPSDTYLLLIKDINGEMWLYQTRLSEYKRN